MEKVDLNYYRWAGKSGPVSGACLACSNSASAMWLTAFMSCASMVLSLLGAQTRMRKIADVPVQKMMGTLLCSTVVVVQNIWDRTVCLLL